MCFGVFIIVLRCELAQVDVGFLCIYKELRDFTFAWLMQSRNVLQACLTISAMDDTASLIGR